MSKRIAFLTDDKEFRSLLKATLKKSVDLTRIKPGNGWVERIKKCEPDLFLLDASGPDGDLITMCDQLRASSMGDRLQVIAVLAESFGATQMEALKAGADDCLLKPIEPVELLSKIRLHLQLRDAMRALTPAARNDASYDSELERLVAEQAHEIVTSHRTSVLELASLAEARELDSGERLLRMRFYSLIIAQQLNRVGPYADRVDVRFLDHLYRSVPLHDIGRIGISSELLSKQVLLDTDEIETLRRHTTIGAIFLEQFESDGESGSFLPMAAELARSHHEWFDGTGYPEQKAGEQIPLSARIVAVADMYEHLTASETPTGPSMPETAKAAIEQQSGSHFDPAVIEAFRAGFSEIEATQQRLSDEIPLVAGAASFLE